MPQIVATAVAFPPHYYDQAELERTLLGLGRRDGIEFDPRKVHRLFEAVSVEGRYLALPVEEYFEKPGFGARNDAWISSALALGETVPRRFMPTGVVELLRLGVLSEMPEGSCRAFNGVHYVSACGREARASFAWGSGLAATAVRLAREPGIDDVVEHRSGNAHTADLGSDIDVLVLSNFVHHFSAEDNVALLRRGRRAMSPGATLCIWDHEARGEHDRPELAADALALYFRVTSSSRCFSAPELCNFASAAGYEHPHVVRSVLAPGRVLVHARVT